MKKTVLLFVVAAFWCAGAASASMVSVDEKTVEKSWPLRFTENRDEQTRISFSAYDRDDHRDELKERRFDFDRDNRRHRRFDCEPPSTVPVPGSIILFLSGIAAFIGVAHKKKV